MYELKVSATQKGRAVLSTQNDIVPHVLHGGIRVIDPGSAGDDPIKIPRETLRLHQCLSATGRASCEVRVIRWPVVVAFYDGLSANCNDVGSSIPEIHLSLEIVVSPETSLTFVAHIRDDASIPAS